MFKVTRDHTYQPFGDERFKQMVARAVQMKDTANFWNDQRLMSHQSCQRVLSINQTFPNKLVENVKGFIDVYARKVIEVFSSFQLTPPLDKQPSS